MFEKTNSQDSAGRFLPGHLIGEATLWPPGFSGGSSLSKACRAFEACT
jgi:hypothetical protein